MARLKLGFIPIEGGHYYREALEEVTRAEDLGFDSVWMEEHHSVANHYWPSPFTVLAGFATRTSRVTLGTDIAVAAFYHPVRLAEDVALLDVMSGGRAVLGIALGYKPDEFALYGVDLARRGARFEEQLEIVRGLWTRDRVSFKGTYYTVEGRLEPRPVQTPHPPLWIGGWGDLTLRRAATLGDNWIPGPTADLARLLAGKRQFLANLAAAGRPAPQEWPLTRDLIIADTDRRARELATAVGRATGRRVELFDERLTTAQAEREMIGRGMRREKRKERIDSAAAALLLDAWLEVRRGQEETTDEHG